MNESTVNQSASPADAPDGTGSADLIADPRWPVVESFLTMLDIVSPPLSGHCRRVGQWCRELAVTCDVDVSTQRDFEIAGLLHDLGLLLSSSRGMRPSLSIAVREPRHPVHGHAVLGRIAGFEAVAKAILHHHERFDGRGFPNRMTGMNIPVMARALAVADRYDHVVYPDMSLAGCEEDAARRDLIAETGRSLDPEFVKKQLFILSVSQPVRRHNANEYQITPSALRPAMVLSRDLRSTRSAVLLKADTCLTQEMIDRLLRAEGDTWLTATAYVTLESVRSLNIPGEIWRDEIVAQAPNTSTAAQVGERRARILVADDSVSVCNALRRELARRAIDIHSVATIQSAMQALATGRFEAMVTEMVFPDGNGLDLLQRVAGQFPGLHCLVLSRFASPENVRAIQQLPNVVRFVTKPWASSVLYAAVQEAIEKSFAGTARIADAGQRGGNREQS